MDVLKEVEKIEQEMISWREYLHENAEVGFDLPNTVAFVCKKLDEFGIPYQKDVGSPCSVVGMINGDKEGKTIAIRADMDALPVEEKTGLSFAAKNGNMHACGHDAHTAILLGTAKVIQENRNSLNGRVKLIFQPAEELGTGSKGICEAGALKDVDEIIGLHVGRMDDAPNGTLIFSEGSMLACMDKFTLKIIGIGAHGSQPESSVDPITIGAQIVSAIQNIRSRELDSREPGVITIGSFHAGSAFNIIPQEAFIEGTVRAVNQETREFIAKRIGEVAESVAKGLRAKTEYEFFFQPPPLVNTKEVTDRLIESAKKLFPDKIKMQEKPVMGGEDFAWYLEEVPGAFVFLQNPMEIEGRTWPHHNCRFALDESAFKNGVALFVQYVIDQLQ